MSDDLVKMCRRLSKYAHAQLSASDLERIADRIEEVDAKLAKAVEALEEAWFMLTVPLVNYEPEPEEPGLRRIKSTLAELKGETDAT
jgi:phosphate uptake regulator